MTLRQELEDRGHYYQSNFERAADIDFDTTEELCHTLGYILGHVKRIDAEIPDDKEAEVSPNYIINNGTTSGGNEMKRGSQYRIYFNNIENLPCKLRGRLQNDGQMRMTGSAFVESCFEVGFQPGCLQNDNLIRNTVNSYFTTQEERRAFEAGYNE